MTIRDTPAVVNAIDANKSVNARTKLFVTSPTEQIIANNIPLDISEILRQETKKKLNNSCVKIANVDSEGANIKARIFLNSNMDEI